MPLRIRVGSRAWESVGEISSYLASHASLSSARRFYQTFHEDIASLADFPEIGAVWESTQPRLRGLRFWPMTKPFQKYLVYYRLHKSVVEVVEVIHGARDIEAFL